MRDRKRIEEWVMGLLCGALVGGGAILPGVSGGVLCVIFGLYRPLMEILTHPKRALPLYWRRFVPVIIGWAVGFLVFAKVIVLLFGASEFLATWLFIGLIAGTFPMLYREAGREGRTKGAYFALAIGFLLMAGSLYYAGHVAMLQVEPNFWWYNFCGVLWGMSVVIPGMTSASVLMSLGLYQPLTEGIVNLDPMVMTAWIPGMVLTILLLARLMNYLFRAHYPIAYHAVLGIVIASTLLIVPTAYTGIADVVGALLCFAAGFAVAFLLDKM
ncbi:MAG: DUF368 domain-containing protein, partial [Oscillospiraceae bacterium]